MMLQIGKTCWIKKEAVLLAEFVGPEDKTICLTIEGGKTCFVEKEFERDVRHELWLGKGIRIIPKERS